MKRFDNAARMLFLLCFGGVLLFSEAAWAQPESAPRYIMQNITADSRTSRTISWQTDTAQAHSEIEYGVAGREETWRRRARLQAFSTDEGTIFLHIVTLERLKPATAYRYRVGAPGLWSEWHSFETESKGAFQALLFPDSQCVDYGVWKKTADLAWQRNRDARFFINMGDLVDNGEHWYQWKAWLEGASGMIERIPAAPVEGNHEAYSLQWKFTPPATYLSLFHLPKNGAPGLEEQTYSYDYGAVHFVVLDTQAEELVAFQPDLITRQTAWLEKDLAATKQRWKVILMHKPAVGYPAADGSNALGKEWMPLFERFGVAVVFQAHLHSYSRTVPLYGGRPARRGTVYVGTGRSGDDAWNEVPRKASDRVFYDAMDQPNYLTLTVDEKRLQVKCFKQDGTVVDCFVIPAERN